MVVVYGDSDPRPSDLRFLREVLLILGAMPLTDGDSHSSPTALADKDLIILSLAPPFVVQWVLPRLYLDSFLVSLMELDAKSYRGAIFQKNGQEAS